MDSQLHHPDGQAAAYDNVEGEAPEVLFTQVSQTETRVF